MPWMRAAIGVGGVTTAAGVAGMLVFLDDRSNYFGVAVALALAGFLTLVACKLTMVFGSSHGSQDDAFRRGKEMGYDAGFVDGRRTAKPVVVPMLRVVGGDKDGPVVPRHQDPPGAARHQGMPLVARDHRMRGVARDQEMRGVEREQEIPVSSTGLSDLEHVERLRFTPPIQPVRRRQAEGQLVGWDRVVAWMRPRRIPLLAGALSLALVGVVLVGAAMARPSVQPEALRPSPGSLVDQTVPALGGTPALVLKPTPPRASVAVAAGASPLTQTKPGPFPAVPIEDASWAAVLPSTLVNQPASAPINQPGVAVVTPAIASLPPVTTPSAEPVVAAPVVPLTAAEQTAADALAAANLTEANAKAAADLTAANAAAAADLTAANAAAAAAATAQAAADAAWAVAHP